MTMTPDEVDELFSRAHGVHNDLVALVSLCNPGDALELVANAIANTDRVIALVAKLQPQTEDDWS